MNGRLQELIFLTNEWMENHAQGDKWERDVKLAELVVRECVELSVNSQYVNTKSEYYEGFNEALIYAGNKIKKHFGIE